MASFDSPFGRLMGVVMSVRVHMWESCYNKENGESGIKFNLCIYRTCCTLQQIAGVFSVAKCAWIKVMATSLKCLKSKQEVDIKAAKSSFESDLVGRFIMGQKYKIFSYIISVCKLQGLLSVMFYMSLVWTQSTFRLMRKSRSDNFPPRLLCKECVIIARVT